MTPLSNLQKRDLCVLARRAWAVCPDREALLATNTSMSATEVFEHWRRVEQGKACGRQSLRLCSSERDYLLLRAHWEGLLGRWGRATRTLLRHAEEPRLVALHKLQASCAERGLTYPAYPAAICQRQYRVALDDATAKQIWFLVFTVRNRRTASGARYPRSKFARRAQESTAEAAEIAENSPF